MMISFSKSWLKPWWFLVIWFDLMPSCIPRNLHECTCRGSGRTWFRRARIPRLCRHGSWLCHVPTQDRQTPRRQTLWPSSWHGAHAHEPSHSEASRHQTRPTGTLIPSLKRSLVDFERRNFSKEHFSKDDFACFRRSWRIFAKRITGDNRFTSFTLLLDQIRGNCSFTKSPSLLWLLNIQICMPQLLPQRYTHHHKARTLTLTVSQNLVSCLDQSFPTTFLEEP